MDTKLDTELRMFEELAADFGVKELVLGRQENDRYPYGPLFEDVLKKARAAGFFSVTLPGELDGAGQGTTALCLLLKGICRFDASLGGVIFADTLAKELVYRARGFELLSELLPKVGDYTGFLVAFPAYRDPGEDVELVAKREGDGAYSLMGASDYVVLGGLAASAVLPATVEGVEGFSYFFVDLAGKGVQKSAPVLSLGLHACPAVDMTLNGASGTLIGEEGMGAAYLERAAERMHAAAAAMALGVMQGSFEDALLYAKQRRQGGREIVDWTEVRRILARMAVKAKAADMIVNEACRAADANEAGWQLGAKAAALIIPEMACELTADGIQLLGGNGYMEDYGQEKRFRDAEQIRSLLGFAPMRELGLVTRVIEGEPLY